MHDLGDIPPEPVATPLVHPPPVRRSRAGGLDPYLAFGSLTLIGGLIAAQMVPFGLMLHFPRELEGDPQAWVAPLVLLSPYALSALSIVVGVGAVRRRAWVRPLGYALAVALGAIGAASEGLALSDGLGGTPWREGLAPILSGLPALAYAGLAFRALPRLRGARDFAPALRVRPVSDAPRRRRALPPEERDWVGLHQFATLVLGLAAGLMTFVGIVLLDVAARGDPILDLRLSALWTLLSGGLAVLGLLVVEGSLRRRRWARTLGLLLGAIAAVAAIVILIAAVLYAIRENSPPRSPWVSSPPRRRRCTPCSPAARSSRTRAAASPPRGRPDRRLARRRRRIPCGGGRMPNPGPPLPSAP